MSISSLICSRMGCTGEYSRGELADSSSSGRRISSGLVADQPLGIVQRCAKSRIFLIMGLIIRILLRLRLMQICS